MSDDEEGYPKFINMDEESLPVTTLHQHIVQYDFSRLEQLTGKLIEFPVSALCRDNTCAS